MSDETHIALCSGGRDSVVATHAAMRFGPAEFVVYLDTTTGNRRNLEFVRRFCDEFGWHLAVWRTNYNYGDLIEEYGFPGPSWHQRMYAYLKERQLAFHARRYAGDIHYWTGVYRRESEQRMGRVVAEAEGKDAVWTWRSPCAEWTDAEFARYHDRFRLPTNPLWSTLGRSGDCWCGAFANREELLDDEIVEADHAAWLRDLEADLSADSGGFDDERREEWAWHDDDPSAWAVDEVRDGEQGMLCSHCGEYADLLADGGQR
jgi:3'-phosphoadenosine 5'-phosphosulfate sulfotransferase (PAPS reductase)/FAD synthetase